MNQTATNYMPEDQFSAMLTIDGTRFSIIAPSLADLVKAVGQLRPTEVVGKTAPAKVKDETKPETVKAEPKKEAEKPKADPAALTPEQEKAIEAGHTVALSQAQVEKIVADAEAPRPTYDDVKRAVLALAKISPDTAKATLAKFTGQNGQPCDHGTKLKLEDYPAFLKAAEEVAA